jgi:hypothetical protein
MPHPTEQPLPRLAGAAFRALAAVRGARAVHPRGRTFAATVHAGGGPERYGVDLLDRPGEWPALIRFSRGAGLPDRWPDVLGVALRVPDAGGPGADLDLLVSTTLGSGPGLRHVPAPARALAGPYATVAGYRTRLGRRHLAVLPDPAGPDLGTRLDDLAGTVVGGTASLLLAAAARHSQWRVFGRVVLGAPVGPDVDAALAFDPVVRAIPGLVPDGLLQRIRAGAYLGSRRGRGVDPAAVPVTPSGSPARSPR